MRSNLLATIALVASISGSWTPAVQAGPLIDWLFGGRRQPAYPVGPPVPLGVGQPAQGTVAGFAPLAAAPNGFASNLGVYYGAAMPTVGPAGAGFSQPMQGGITAATMPAQPMSFVPNFNSTALRAPVTYYRPIVTTDPNTGAQVVAMAPCTSYQYMTQRVPALGQTALFGSYQPPIQAPAPRGLTSYTLPSGGIPLAQTAPAFGAPTNSLSYGPYGSYQPALVAPTTNLGGTVQLPAGQPMASTPGYSTTVPEGSNYYGGAGGGSSGTIYSNTVPGLTAPQGPYSPSPTPSYPLGTSPTPYSPTPSYSTSPEHQVLPPSTDPGDLSPSLPYNGLRPQLRSIVPEVDATGAESAFHGSAPASRPANGDATRELPVMSPIPAPEGLERPRWSPGLMRESDMTALRPVTRTEQYAGQSKKIHWASFEQDSSGLSQDSLSSSHTVWALELTPSAADQAASPSSQSVHRAMVDEQPYSGGHRSAPTTSPPTRYDNSGWKASR